jgi:tRNA A22 N-methylase
MSGWTARIFELSVHDHRSGLEIVGTIQAFLDERARSLPRRARQAREDRLESDEFGSLGFDLDTVTIAGLGGPTELDPIEQQDEEFAKVTPSRELLTDDDLPSLTMT